MVCADNRRSTWLQGEEVTVNMRKYTTVALTAALIGFSALPSLAEGSSDEQIRLSNSLAGNYLAARIAATDNDTENAAVFFRKALSLDGGNPNLKLQSFLNFVSNGDFAEGVALGDEIAAAEDSPEIVGIILAVDDLRKKSWAKAESRLDRPWRSALDRLMAGLILGWVKQGQGDLAAALKTVDELNGPPWFDLFVQYHGGLMALASGKPIEAVKRLDQAYNNRSGGQAANETYARVIESLAQAHFEAGDATRAVALIEDGLNRAPQNPGFRRMSERLSEGRDPGFAVASARRGAGEVFLNLGTAIDKEGGEQFARIYLRLAHSLTEDDVVVTELAELLDRQGMEGEANVLFSRVPETSPLYRIARLEIALNLDQLEDLAAARKELDALLESGPDDLIAHLSYGAVLARHDKFGDAIGIYQKIIDRIEKPQRFHWNLYYRLGIAYERTKQWPKAEETFRKALELYPDQPSVLNYLGYSWVDQSQNLQEGLDMIRKAVELQPNDGYMVDSLGWAYYRLKRFQEAVVELERAVELRPGDPTINDHLGDAYWRANRKLEATFQWNHALALDPPEADIPRIEDKLENGLDAVEEREAADKKKPDNG